MRQLIKMNAPFIKQINIHFDDCVLPLIFCIMVNIADCNPVEIISLNMINPVNIAQYLLPNVFEIADGNIVYVALFINHKQEI